MDATHGSDNEQAMLWNGPSGRAWIEMQDVIDRTFKPLEDLLVNAVSSGRRNQVLEVGCGTGALALAVARQLEPEGNCTGIDISQPMIAIAGDRMERESAPASFICANAQSYAFTPASFDMIISRFGVMFFEDPVQAFANLRRAARADAELRFIAWRDAAENPFMTTAERVAAPLLPDLPARRPDAPGSSDLLTGTVSAPFSRKAAGPGSISGRLMSPAPSPRRNWFVISRGSARSAVSFRAPTRTRGRR